MKFFVWLQAYAIVYSGMVRSLSRGKFLVIAALVFVAIIASLLGPLPTAIMLVIGLFILPAINTDVRQAIDKEYNKLNNR